MKLLPDTKQKRIELLILLAMPLFWNAVAYLFPRLISGSWHHYDMTTSLDAAIPFLPWTITIYFGCFLVWGINYYLCAMQEERERNRFYCADAVSKIICMVIFLAIPTTNVRPEIPADGNLWNLLMRLLYALDSADNLFPSMHCLVSWMCWVGVRKRKEIPAVYRHFSLVAAIAVFISTLTTKQHVMVDIFASVILAEFSYFVSGLPWMRRKYDAILSRLFSLFRARESRS